MHTDSTSLNEDQVSELISFYTSVHEGKRRWFSRKMRELTKPAQDQVYKKLEKMGFDPLKKKESKTKNFIRWTDEEWNRLANIVLAMRKTDPCSGIIELVKKAVMQFPEERRRNIPHRGMIQPLINLIREKDKNIDNALEELTKLKSRFTSLQNTPTKDEILNNLSETEVIQKYSRIILDNLSPHEILDNFSAEELLENFDLPELMGHCFKQLTKILIEKPAPIEKPVINEAVYPSHKIPVAIRTPIVEKKPKVLIVGLLPEQQNILSEKLGDKASFNFLDKNRKGDIPSGQDIYVVWARHCSHSMQECVKKQVKNQGQLMIHHGGLTRLIDWLDTSLPKK